MQTLVSFVNFFCYPVLRMYWRVWKPKTSGVKVCIIHGDKILFVQHSYGYKEWTIPGGGIKRHETAESAAKREVLEEVGIAVNTIVYKGSFLHTEEGKHNTIHVFLGYVTSDAYHIDGIEIRAASWEYIPALTLTRSPIARKCLEKAGILPETSVSKGDG